MPYSLEHYAGSPPWPALTCPSRRSVPSYRSVNRRGLSGQRHDPLPNFLVAVTITWDVRLAITCDAHVGCHLIHLPLRAGKRFGGRQECGPPAQLARLAAARRAAIAADSAAGIQP